jgi:hypothetical protein
MMNYNNLVVRVLRAQGLQLKNHKSLDIYVSLRTSGKGLQYKSKVDTNNITSTDGSAVWDESCEFSLSELENELQVGICHKGKLGTKESLGTLNFDLTLLPQFQPPKPFRLTKKGNDEKDRGVLYLGFEFSNKIGTSISNFSLNTIGGGVKEKRLDKLKRKMHLGKKKNKDAMSLASVSLSRKSSFSSVTSALAFSPSPNQMHRRDSFQQQHDGNISGGKQFDNICEHHEPHHQQQQQLNISTSSHSNSHHSNINDSGNDSFHNHKPHLSPQPSICSMRSEAPNSASPPKGLRSKMREKAEKWLHVKPDRKRSSDDFRQDSSSVANFPMGSSSNDRNSLGAGDAAAGVRHRNSFAAAGTPSIVSHSATFASIPLSRPTSIASSSGFASLGSQNVNSALNETTSPEYLLKVVEHLRKELHQKETKIRDLQEYLDKLLSRVIETHPEVLQVNNRHY